MKDCKKYCAELIGTAILVFIACGTAVYTNANIVATALAFGLTIVALAYTIGHISGAHVNPAVSLGALITRKMNAKDFCFYIVAQFIGAIAGGALLFAVVKLSGLTAAGNMGANGYIGIASTTAKQIALAMIIEVVLTFVFVLTILGVTSRSENNKVAGIVIGLTLTLVHLIGINLTGTSVNPARSLGVAIFGGTAALEQVWLFIIAPLAGAALAAIAAIFLFTDKTIDKPQTITQPSAETTSPALTTSSTTKKK